MLARHGSVQQNSVQGSVGKTRGGVDIPLSWQVWLPRLQLLLPPLPLQLLLLPGRQPALHPARLPGGPHLEEHSAPQQGVRYRTVVPRIRGVVEIIALGQGRGGLGGCAAAAGISSSVGPGQ